VISELLGDPKLSENHKDICLALHFVELLPGYWKRAGFSRSELIKKKLKARLADALVAQACIDHDFPQIARDKDFSNEKKILRAKSSLINSKQRG